MPKTSWIVKSYNLEGGDEVVHTELTNRTWVQPLNGFDMFEFDAYLDGPNVTQFHALRRIVKLWRNVNDPANGKYYTAPAQQPSFGGVVANVRKDGASNMMHVQCYSPLWQLQFKFHLLNHRLVKNNLPGDPRFGLPWDQSELLWKIIDLTQDAFATAQPGYAESGFGIGKGTWPITIQISPFYIAQGSNVWSNVSELLNRPGGAVDILPVYYHVGGNDQVMTFNTSKPRGGDISATTKFDYRTGQKNLENLVEDLQVIPGRFGNYIWSVGQGGSNSNKIGVDFDASTNLDGYGYGAVQVYMAIFDHSEIQNIVDLDKIAESDLALSKFPTVGYSVAIQKLAPPYYETDFKVGDVIALNANKGPLLVSNKKRRIYQVTLRMSDNDVESADVLLGEDYKKKVVP